LASDVASDSHNVNKKSPPNNHIVGPGAKVGHCESMSLLAQPIVKYGAHDTVQEKT
jgi:hypothetical protein